MTKTKNLLKFGYFWKACIVTFQKSNICPDKLFETSELFEEIHFNSSNFQLTSALEPIWQSSSKNFVVKFLSCILQLMKFLKRYLSSKFIQWNWRYPQFNDERRVKSNEKAIWISTFALYTFFDKKSKISSVSVDGFWWKISFWKRH